MPFNPGKTSFTVVSGMGDELGGASKPSKMAIEEEVHPTGKSTVESDHGEKNEAYRFQEPNMETIKTGAQFSPKSQKNRIPLSEVITSKSVLSTYHTNSFDFDVQEIEVALGSVDSCEKHVASNLIDTSHVLANNDATATPSMPTHTQTSQEQAPHVATNRTLRTWKRLACDSTMETEITQRSTARKRHRDEDLEVLPELPIKKIQEYPRVLSNIVPGFKDGRVSDLINPSTRTWDANLVHGLLSPEEAALVLKGQNHLALHPLR
nr:hypothetical protein CFP56_45988 [Quercus suber]